MLALSWGAKMPMYRVLAERASNLRCLQGDGTAFPVDPMMSRRGRKAARESRAVEIRAGLMVWKQTPEAYRSSLRGLAAEMGTSRQLLSHYLKHWDKWQAKEYRRQAAEIRSRVEAEMRPWIADEMLRQADAYDRTAFWSTIDALLEKTFQRLQREAKASPLNAMQLKMLKLFASNGHSKAQELLENLGTAKTSPNNLPPASTRARKSFGCGRGITGNSSKMRSPAEVEIKVINVYAKS
jgi:hypothetical protein